jgi:hypothetical protein
LLKSTSAFECIPELGATKSVPFPGVYSDYDFWTGIFRFTVQVVPSSLGWGSLTLGYTKGLEAFGKLFVVADLSKGQAFESISSCVSKNLQTTLCCGTLVATLL